jgi:uncharacterized protein (TIGR02996 family)
MRTFTFTDGESDKFWNIELSGKSFTVTFGRTGTKGRAQTKSFPSAAAAQKEHDKLVGEKLRKGYVEANAPAAAAAPDSVELRALEQALVDHPDDVATHSAYADYLTEQGVPRGEFAQVQIALEDPSRAKIERARLAVAEDKLLRQHARTWLGGAGKYLVGDWSGTGKPYEFRFARGWLDYVRTPPHPEALVAALAASPEARLLRHLELVYDMRYHPYDFDEYVEKMNKTLPDEEQLDTGSFYMAEGATLLKPLAESEFVRNLRVLHVGYGNADEDGTPTHSTMIAPFEGNTMEELLALIENNTLLDELYLNVELGDVERLFKSPLLGRLRVFQFYFGTGEYTGGGGMSLGYPLGVLADNKHLRKLTTLRLHPGREAEIDTEELDALLNCEYLTSLEHLQVHMAAAGDEVAERVVRSGILKRLKTLDLAYGNMTSDGARALAACKDLKNLEVLDVSRNALNATGVKALRATGVTLVADDMHAPNENDYLYEVDRE